ncbi:MAG: hypothetical protein NT157_02030 [Candidatus Micrarchaeota archaeon]|nr:hypothetical protein [Candidatus Micrarchaeota archaeon]
MQRVVKQAPKRDNLEPTPLRNMALLAAGVSALAIISVQGIQKLDANSANHRFANELTRKGPIAELVTSQPTNEDRASKLMMHVTLEDSVLNCACGPSKKKHAVEREFDLWVLNTDRMFTIVNELAAKGATEIIFNGQVVFRKKWEAVDTTKNLDPRRQAW